MIGNKIRELRKEKGLNMRQMAVQLGLPYTTYINYEKNIHEPPNELTVRLAKHFGVSVDYLMGNAPIDERDNPTARYPQLKSVKTRQIPLLGKVACGKPIFDDTCSDSVNAPADIKCDFCLICEGDSMINARIRDGDIVYIRQADMVDNGKIAAVAVDDEVTLKRVYYYPEKSKLILSPENPDYEPFVYIGEELNSIRILGLAVGFTSTL